MAKSDEPISMGSPRFTTVDLPSMRITDMWFPPNACLPRHTHERPVFAVVLSGSIDSRLPSRRLECESTTVWTEPAGEAHENRIGAEGARVVATLPDPGREPVFGRCGPLLDEVHHLRHGGIADLARRMVHELDGADDAARLTLEGLALEGLALGLRSRSDATVEARLPDWLAQARDLVHDRFEEALEIAEIAEEVGVEATVLARAFRAHFRVPLGTYQRRLRLDRAAEILAATDVPLSRVALRAGFYDQSHLSRHFRRYTGQTPGEYRRNHHVG